MKNLFILLIFSLLPLFGQAQLDRYTGAERIVTTYWDSVAQDSVSFTYFRLRDTLGDPSTGTYKVDVTLKDSASFVQMLMNRIEDQYTTVGQSEAGSVQGRYMANQWKDFATQIVGSNIYQGYMNQKYRQYLAGNWNYRRNGTLFPLYADQNGNFNTVQDSVLRLKAYPQSRTFLAFTDAAHGNEIIEFFEVEQNLWVGESADGRVILRKQ